MPNTINADDGVVSGSAGLKYSSDSSGVLALQSNGTTALTVSGANVTITGTLTGGIAVPQVTVYTSGSGTYTVPTGARYLEVQMVGGGGAGGSGASGAGGGGGAGGYLKGFITSSLSATYSYAVGAASGNTTFGTALFAANGGSAGVVGSTSAAGGAGGSATGGSLNVTGAQGGYGWGSAPYYNGGYGAASAFGGGGMNSGTNNGNGSSGVVYGSGGGGGVGGGSGGAGVGGVIIVTAYF
jgi:hypothetical protein